ncbi:MAG TPA: response regulator transcription factor [Anaerolineae bacterium]|nr:response regulator transcription factor [Anaerolineae bacterium]HIP70385.1 response regulator transcription factor [Anaerolineae bacterium]
MSDPVTVLIVDDHPIVRQGMEMFLETQEQVKVMGLAENGAEAVHLVAATPPDVVLMDLNMPGMDGIEATRQIRQISPQTKVVVLTSHHEDAMVFPAVKAGALSYLLKSAAPDEVLDTILAAARGEARLHPRIAKRLMDEVAGTSRSLTALTTRELEVLKLIARGYDNRTIAAQLTLSEKTVKTHVSNILSKLGLTDRTQAAIYALRQKIVPLDEPEE